MLAVAMIATATFAQEFQINRAKYLIENGDYKEAAIILRPLADKGNAEAQYMASQLFAQGKGVVKSTQQAERYLRLSAQNGYVPAMEDYSDVAYKKKDYATAYKWMKAAYDKETTSYRGFCLGYMTYVGQGTQADKKEGWEFMYANLDSETSRSKIIEEFHTEFYRYLVDSYLNDPVNMRVSLETTYAAKYGKVEWVDEVTDYLFEKLATLPEQQQNEHLKVWQSKFGSYLSVYIYAMMLEKGICTKKSHATAYYYASMLYTRDLKPYPSMKKGVESIVFGYIVGQTVLGSYKVVAVSSDGKVTLDRSYDGEMTFTPRQLAGKEAQLHIKRDEHEKKKKNIKVVSSAPQINVLGASASFTSGKLVVTLQVKLKAMNKCFFETSNASLVTSSGKSKSGYVTVKGLKTIGSQKNILMPDTIAYVELTFYGLSANDEISRASCNVRTNFGSGVIMAKDFAY